MADIQRYGFPMRPKAGSAPGALAQWEDIIRHAKVNLCTVGQSDPTRPISHAAPPYVTPYAYDGVHYSPNWSGYHTSGDSTFNYVSAQWNIPCYNGSYTPSNAAALSWVGLGGWYDNDLWQGGTTEDKLTGYEFWYQFVPFMSLPHYITNFNAHCADRVDVEADYNRSAPNTSYIWLQDYTSGHYVAETYGAIPGQHSADWVDERTDCKPINGNYRLLADFVTVGWTGAYAAASDTAGGNVENLTYWQYWRTVMTNDGTPNTSTLASPLLPGSDGKSFSDYWYNNGYNNGC